MVDALTGVLLGLAGSLHCAAMCGPIALALPAESGSRGRFLAGRLLYNGGRIITYVILGGILGSIGGLFALAGLQQTLSITIGVLMIAVLFLPGLIRRLSAIWSPVSALHSLLHRKFGQLLRHRSHPALLGFGMLNGLLPCGLLYAALAAAAALGGPLRGMVFLSAFGAGTLPVMLSIGLAGTSIRLEVRKRIAALLPVFTFALGLLLILRGLNLGIPYISPHVSLSGEAAVESCCH
jgi:sulfite exporter TauE/SafE